MALSPRPLLGPLLGSLLGPVLLATTGLTGCASPAAPAPAAAPLAVAAAPADHGPAAWWRSFGSAELDGLIEQALRANRDLAAATARVEQARALGRGAQAERAPQLAFNGAVGHGRDASTYVKSDYASGGFRAAWEIDLFGGRRQAAQAAALDAQGAELALRALGIAIAAEVATTYADAAALTRREAVYREEAALLERQLDVARRRVEAGLASRAEVDRISAEGHAQRATAEQLQGLRQVRLRQLAVLLGSAQALPPLGFAADLQADTGAAPLPAQLLERRPDVQRQARAVDAAAARLGVARSDLYPRLQLDWSARRDRAQFEGGGSGSTLLIGYGLSVSLPILDGGRIRANIEVHEAQAREAMAEYEKAMLVALGDADVALRQQAAAQAAVQSWEQAVQAGRDAGRRTRRLFAAGQADLTTVLDVERSTLQAQDALLQARAAQWSAAVAVRRAFAGAV